VHNITAAITAFLLLTLGATDAVSATDRTGWSVSAGVGASTIEDKDGDDTFDGNSVGFAAEVEYRFTPNFALGIGGFSLGSDNDMFAGEDTEISVRGFDISGRLIFPLSDSTELFGRLGAANYYVDVEPGFVDLADTLFGSDATELGIGIDFLRRNKAAVRVEYRYYNGGSDETGALLLLGLNFLF